MSRRAPLASSLVALSALGCGTVDPGADIQIAQVVYDQNFFYCRVEPMLIGKNCGPGESGTDAPSGCHFNVTTFRLTPHEDEPIQCGNDLVPDGSIPPEAQSNYQAAAREMSRDPDLAQLLNRPTRKAAHPRQIFPSDSPEADLIREWATKYTSQ